MSEPAAPAARGRFTPGRHSPKLDLLFFCAGFTFDVWAARAGVDHTLMIVQQVAYLGVIGTILYFDFVREASAAAVAAPAKHRPWVEKLLGYRSLVFHFCLGTLMNLYSIFFLMSASWFSSMVFVVLLLTAVLLNEMRTVRRGVDVKVALSVVSLFCFFSLMIPLLVRSVGTLTFVLAFIATCAVVVWFYGRLRRRLGVRPLIRRLLLPAAVVLTTIVGLYFARLIPPVPIAAKKLGVYHRVERTDRGFLLFHERPWWRFWQAGDQAFDAEPGDKVHVFTAIYSPTHFDDTIIVRWLQQDGSKRWLESDRIPVRITGGRAGGFRGYTSKANYTPGNWRVIIETRDEREIARLTFTITSVAVNPARALVGDKY